MRGDVAASPLREDRHPEAEQEILEDLDVAGDRLPLDLAIARDVGEVEDAAVREADGFEESSERADVPRQPFEPHLSFQIEGRVGAQDLFRPAGIDDEGQEPALQGIVQPKLGQLRRHERVEALDERAAGEEVEAPATELSGARTGKDETPAVARFEEPVDDAQELRNPLHLVEDHRVAVGLAPDEIAETLRPRGKLSFQLGTQEVEVEGVRKDVPKPRRLPRPARSEQKEALRGRLEEARRYFRSGSQNGNPISGMLIRGGSPGKRVSPLHALVRKVRGRPVSESPPKWWTRAQSIRTVSEVVLKFPLVAAEPPLDQRIAPEVVRLQRLGLCNRRIAKALAVDAKTVAKALRWSLAFN